MIAANLLGTIAATVILAPSVLAVFGANANSTWPNIFIATGVITVMLVIAVVGIRPTARVQVSMAVIEYAILISVDGLLYAAFYILTALAVIAYYWHRIVSNAWDALLVGILQSALSRS